MKYADIRTHLSSGDVLMVKNRSLVSAFIRVATGESFNHVAMVLRTHKGVFVVEMREGIGWQMMPASQWMEVNKKAEVYWGKAPNLIRGSYCIEDYALKQRGRRYSYWSLLTVWLSQVFLIKTPSNLVCSTFIQEGYKDCGHPIEVKTLDPGDWIKYLTDINLVTV